MECRVALLEISHGFGSGRSAPLHHVFMATPNEARFIVPYTWHSDHSNITCSMAFVSRDSADSNEYDGQ